MITNTSGTKCPYCESTKFELVQDIPEGGNMNILYLRCESCKRFLGLSEFASIRNFIEQRLH